MSGQYKHVCGPDVWRDDNPEGVEFPNTAVHPMYRDRCPLDLPELRRRAEAYLAAKASCVPEPYDHYFALVTAREALMAAVDADVLAALILGG